MLCSFKGFYVEIEVLIKEFLINFTERFLKVLNINDGPIKPASVQDLSSKESKGSRHSWTEDFG